MGSLDVGGTSTDVSRYDGRYETVYETTTAGVTIQSPQLDINTVAAGGGSCLTFRNGLFLAGPESAGAEPGPGEVCIPNHRRQRSLTSTSFSLLSVSNLLLLGTTRLTVMTCRKGGPLAVTDANLMLGRLIPDYFPKIFGKTEDQPLDIEASKRAFEKIAEDINESFEKKLSLDEVVYGFIKVANETMCRPIRTLTEARGFATSKHMQAALSELL